ncbi:MAG: hypothetical protein WBM44_00165 [Waterburya sp.]
MIKPISRQYGRSLLLNKKGSLSNWKTLSLKTSIFLLSTVAMLAPSLSVKAEIIMGIIENYNPQNRQATINLGKKDGVGKYDRGKIELTSLDSPDVKFIGANIVVVSVGENSAVVTVREAPGVQVPIQAGAEVTLDTDSGIARREEEAKIIASQQAEEASRQQQLEAARAEQARRQRELEAARAAEIRRQQQLEVERIEAARRQQQLEAERIEAERIEAERIEAERIEAERIAAARRQQELEEAGVPKVPPQLQQEKKPVDLNEAQDLWSGKTSPDPKASASDLPLDYLQAYNNAREQPSPETHYKFAEVLINYEISDQALAWLKETELRFPATKAVNNLYRAVALIQQGNIRQGQSILEAANLPDNQLADEFKSYLYAHNGQWKELFALSETKDQDSAVIHNNRLIALYCTKPMMFDRDTDLSPTDCPFGSAPPQPEPEDVDDEDEERAKAESDQNRETLRKIGEQAIATYPDDPYILNTLSFIALQSEDYQLAYEYYQELAILLDQYESTPPRLQLLKANAIKYVNNYNQNYEFLAENGEDLDSLRSQQNSVTDAIIIGGAGSAVASAFSSSASPVGIVGGLLATFLSFNKSRSRAKGISEERNSIADQMHITFTNDINLVPTPPNLEAKSLLNLNLTSSETDLDSSEMDRKLHQFDDFWEKN